MKFYLLVICLLVAGCTPDHPKSKPAADTVSRKVSGNQLAVTKDTVLSEEDSLERAYDQGKYYFPFIVRLRGNQPFFLALDSEYVAASIEDTAARNLYFRTDRLLPEEREAFYRKMVAAIPRNEIEVFNKVVALPEVKAQAAGSDGGLYTLMLWLVERPDKNNPYYSVEIKRMYYWRWGTCIPIGFLKIHQKSHRILVMDQEGNYLPLSQWKRLE